MTTEEIFEYSRSDHSLSEMIEHHSFRYIKVKSYYGREYLSVFFRCTDSPSGVLGAGGGLRFELNEDNNKILLEHKAPVHYA